MDGNAFGEHFDWTSLASGAGDVGRFIWYLKSSECEIDQTLRDMTAFKGKVGRFTAAEFIDQIHFEDQSLVWMALNETLVTGTPYSTEFRFVRTNGEVIWLAAHGRLTDVPDGDQVLLGVNYDITEQHSTMERFELVAGEMEHRVKNLLTIVANVYRSSARTASSVETLSDSFLPRLVALASLNELAARSGHKEIDVDLLVETVMQPVTGRNVTCRLDGCYVNGTMSQTLALVLNELMTNATKYGGLADDAGEVLVEIRTDDDLFTLIWTEKATYDVRAPVNPTGFGMEVLNNITAATFQGRPQFNWRKEGLVFTCEWPLEKVATG